MLGQRPEPGRGAEEKHLREPQPEPAAPAAAAPPAPKAEPTRSWQAWIPLLVAVVAMPLLAYGVTTLVLVPHFQKSLRGAGAVAAEAGKSGHAGTEASTGNGPAHAGQRQSVSLNKLLVNVAGTMGSRYLLASLVVMGDGADFQGRIAQKEPQLRDLASGLLSAKTIADLEKPGARNLIRGELLAGFNTIMGQPGVQEIYFTEFAIQ